MKKIVIFLVATFCVQMMYAEPITQEQAQEIGEAFLSQSVMPNGIIKVKKANSQKLRYVASPQQKLKLTKSKGLTSANEPYYIFTTDDEGFVIVAGDDRALPILGYSDTGTFDFDNIPPQLKGWLEGYAEEITFAQKNNLQKSEETDAQWQRLKARKAIKPKAATIYDYVEPLVKTKWDQAPYYNKFCPYDNDYGERAVTGCAATAMAQVMNYWQWPKVGLGQHSYTHKKYGTLSAQFGYTEYDWDNMPIRLSESSTTAQDNAVATLMYHCGVAVEMNYDVSENGGSGAYVVYENLSTKNWLGIEKESPPNEYCVETALRNYFGYTNSVKGLYKSRYTHSTWISILKEELSIGRPMVYAGFGSGGHCFVCDGYDSRDYFHFNWGWDGYCDGYYSLSALEPGEGGIGAGNGSYTQGQQAIINIFPDENTAEKLDFQLKMKNISTASSTWFGNELSVTAQVSNKGTQSFNGYFRAGIYDQNDNFITWLDQTKEISLEPNYNTVEMTFTKTAIEPLIPGDYYVIIAYQVRGTDKWYFVKGGDSQNFADFLIKYSADIEVNSELMVNNNEQHVYHGRTADLGLIVKNTSASKYVGKYCLAISNTEGNISQILGFVAEPGLESSKTRYAGFQDSIEVMPGTYFITLLFSKDEDYCYAGSTNYQNPIKLIVEQAPLAPDQYEPNNDWGTAHEFIANFIGDSAIIETQDANFHIDNDIDCYGIYFAPGYSYEINIMVYDKFNNDVEKTFTADASFFYVTEFDLEPQYFETATSEPIILTNGGALAVCTRAYWQNETGTYKLVIYAKRKKLDSQKFVIVAKRTTGNYFYMTADLGTAGTKRFQAVDAGTDKLWEVNRTDLESKFVWEAEMSSSTVKLKNGNQYVDWTSGNSATLSAAGRDLDYEIDENFMALCYLWEDETTSRVLSLNATEGNNYFAFYRSGQIENLYLLKYEELVDERDCAKLPFTESFANNSQGDFTIANTVLPAGATFVWQTTGTYGMKASAYIGNTNKVAESWLISPCIDLGVAKKPVLTFDHAHRYAGTPNKELTLWISDNYIEGDPSSATWTQLTIPHYTSNSNWNFESSGSIDLSAYVGKNVSLAWKYVSTANNAATWEVKNVSVKETASPVATELVLNENLVVFGREAEIDIFGTKTNDKIEIFTVSGICLHRSVATSDFVAIPMSSGLYIVKIGNEARKVAVK